MNRIASLGAMLFVAAAAAACDASKATGPAQPSLGLLTPSASAAQPSAAVLNGPRAVKGQFEGSDAYGVCDGGLLITSTGVGTVSHLGKTVMVSTICVDPISYSVIGDAPYTLEAANGDEVHGLLTGISYTSYGFDLYTEITGGTGRFAGATGELVFPTASTGTGVWSSGVQGWITY